LLRHLPATDPAYRYRVFVGEGNPPADPAFSIRRTKLRTSRPSQRILWEQCLQPFQLGGLNLLHAMAFVAPFSLCLPWARLPFVVTVYDLTFRRYPEHLPASRRLYLRYLTALSCRHAQRVIAISQSTANDLVNLLGVSPAKIDLAIPGVDQSFRPLPKPEVEAWRQARGLPAKFLLFLGTHEPRKNLAMLVEAYSRIPPAQRIPLVLAGGKGWMNQALETALAAPALAGWVQQPGFLPDSDLVWWYNAAQALVYPSLFEGWGLPITEALACGTPALVSDISSLPEAVGDTGLRLPPHDADAWASAMLQASSDDAWRAEQGERGRAYVSRFTWQNTAAQTLQSYRNALKET
jgi:glycosyltransferase involved in cell wall biosynthesis